jgi:hypothetical protein
VAGLLVSACGLIVGIQPLDVDDTDAGVVRQDAEASTPLDAARVDVAAEAEAGPAPPPRPPERTYVYAVSGRDSLTGPPIVNFNANYGPTATVTVGYVGASCFKQTFVVRNNYEETVASCIKGVDSVAQSASRRQVFAFGYTATTTSTCTPGDVYFTSAPSPGEIWDHNCTGQNSADEAGSSAFSVIGKYRYVGNQVIPIAGSDVPVMHFEDRRTVTGSQGGKNEAEWFFAVEDGILVRLSRTIDIDYNVGGLIGIVHYHESLLMTLTTPPSVLRDAGAD